MTFRELWVERVIQVQRMRHHKENESLCFILEDSL